MYSSRSLQICPLINQSFGKSVLIETNRAGAPFPHCCAAHGASGGPRLPPEQCRKREQRRHITYAETNPTANGNAHMGHGGVDGGGGGAAAGRRRRSALSLVPHLPLSPPLRPAHMPPACPTARSGTWRRSPSRRRAPPLRPRRRSAPCQGRRRQRSRGSPGRCPPGRSSQRRSLPPRRGPPRRPRRGRPPSSRAYVYHTSRVSNPVWGQSCGWCGSSERGERIREREGGSTAVCSVFRAPREHEELRANVCTAEHG